MLLACGVSGVCGLRRRSRLPFVVRHGLEFVDRVLWPLDGPGTCCFLEPSLGFFPLASSVGCWLEVVEVYPWLSSLRSFAVEGVDLVLCWVLVGLPSWYCCASGLLGPVVPTFPVRSPISGPVGVLPQSTTVTLLSLLWLGLLLVLVRFHYLRLTL